MYFQDLGSFTPSESGSESRLKTFLRFSFVLCSFSLPHSLGVNRPLPEALITLTRNVPFGGERVFSVEQLTASPGTNKCHLWILAMYRLSVYHVDTLNLSQGHPQGRGRLAISLICMNLLYNATSWESALTSLTDLTNRPLACMWSQVSSLEETHVWNLHRALYFIARHKPRVHGKSQRWS